MCSLTTAFTTAGGSLAMPYQLSPPRRPASSLASVRTGTIEVTARTTTARGTGGREREEVEKGRGKGVPRRAATSLGHVRVHKSEPLVTRADGGGVAGAVGEDDGVQGEDIGGTAERGRSVGGGGKRFCKSPAMDQGRLSHGLSHGLEALSDSPEQSGGVVTGTGSVGAKISGGRGVGVGRMVRGAKGPGMKGLGGDRGVGSHASNGLVNGFAMATG